jgi:hypothetical protein
MTYPILSVQYPVFKPAMRIISNITNDYPAVVTTSTNHNYITGTIVRLLIPNGYGMIQANKLHANIVVLSDTTFNINLDTTLFSAFTTPITFPEDTQYAQCIPLGEVNSTLLASTKNVLPY